MSSYAGRFGRTLALCIVSIALASCGGGDEPSVAAPSTRASASASSPDIALTRSNGPGCTGLVVNPTNDGSALANNVLAASSGITINSVSYSGAASASGTFNCGQDIIGFDEGIVLTTGTAPFVIGPNNEGGAGIDNGSPATALIDSSFNATTLTINFTPEGNTVQFQYVFGSEEYNYYVNSIYNDAFRFFINGQNYALLPGDRGVVEINNVNNGQSPSDGVGPGPCQNCEFFVDNNPVGAAPRNTQLDGFTTVLTFTAPVIAGQVNTLVMVIADRSDAILDSAVFIKGQSFTVPPPGGPGGDVHLSTYGAGNVDWHGAGCYRLAEGNNFRFEMDAEPYAPNPGTSIAARAAFTFPKTANPHTVIVNKSEPFFELRSTGLEDSTAVTDGNTIRFYANGTQNLLGTIVTQGQGDSFEVNATYASGTLLRAFVWRDVVVDANLHPVSSDGLNGLTGVYPMRGDGTVLSSTLQPYSVYALQNDVNALNEYALSWACTTGQSLFDITGIPPTVPAAQASIVTVDPAAEPAATQACTDAGVPTGRVERLANCVLDVSVSGPDLGPIMAAHSSFVVTRLSAPPVTPDPPQCDIATALAQRGVARRSALQSAEFGGNSLRLITPCSVIDTLQISANKIELNKAPVRQRSKK